MTIPLQPRTEPPKPEDIEAQYGFVALIAKQIPEIGSLMAQAVKENWTADRFSLALASTNWWKTTPDTSRQWLVRQLTDPASAAADKRNGITEIRNLADRLGVTITSDDMALSIWTESMLGGIEGLDLQSLVSHRGQVGGATGGVYGQLVHELMAMSLDYGYTSQDLAGEVAQEAGNLLRAGMTSLDAWKAKLINQAAAKYTPFAERLRGGETLMDIARPYVDTYSKVLEIAPSAVRLTDPHIQRALQGTQPEAGKPPVAKAVWQIEQELRKDPRWGGTNNARQAAAQTLTTIGRQFGMIG
jgi:hypothetical protein